MGVISVGSAFVSIQKSWSDMKALLDGSVKELLLQAENDGAAWRLFCVDQSIFYRCDLFLAGQEPRGWSAEQIAQNAADRADYEANWASQANQELSIVRTTLRQERKTAGHYSPVGIVIPDVPAGATRYEDWVVPDLTNGMDWISVTFSAADLSSGDEIVCGKSLVGPIGALAAPAAIGDTVITVASQVGVLLPTALGGALDEGFYLSLGVDSATAVSLNAGGAEAVEYEIKRIGPQVDVGGGNAVCQLTLFEPLAAAKAAGEPVNLVIRVIRAPIEITNGAEYNFGGSILTAGNLPAGAVVRFGFRNNVGLVSKTVRGVFDLLY